DDARPGRARGGDQRRAADAAAQADRHKDNIRRLQLVEDLQRAGADARDQVGLIGGVDVAKSLAPGQLLAVDTRLVEIAAVLDDLGAKSTHRRHLVGVIHGWYDQDAAHAEQSGRPGQRLPVIARRAAEDAAPLLLVGEPRNDVDAAADLECRRRRVVLVLEVVPAAEQARQRW